MSGERLEEAARIFALACDVGPEERSQLLEEACGDDRELRSEVESLLAYDIAGEGHEVLEAVRERLAKATAPTVFAGSAGSVPERIDGFRPLRRLGVGGMGVVYLAMQEHPRRRVALKVMRSDLLTPSGRRRFEFEAQMLARLSHAGIAQIYEAGIAEGDLPFFAMEYVPKARPITDYAEVAGMETRARLELLARVCDAVHHGHQKGVIHRDLKPGNILIDAEGRPKIIDFGVARTTDWDVAATTMGTIVGQLVGTLHYMSPEQCRADPEDLDTRSDVYALGVVLFELLLSTLPYDLGGTPLPEMARVITSEPPRRPTEIDPALRGDVEIILLKALEKDRERRYQSAGELADDIRRHLAGRAIEARRDSTWYVVRKFVARRRVPLALGLAAAVAILVLLGAVVWQAYENKLRRTEVRAFARVFGDEVNLTDPFSTPEVSHETLDDARAIADETLLDLPEEEAELRELIGLGYLYLRQHEEAEAQFRRALELHEQLHRAPHADIATALHNLGRALYRLDRFDEARGQYEEALSMRRALFGEEHPDVARSLNDLGACLRRQGMLAESESAHREALEMRRRLLEDDDPWIAASLNNLGTSLRDRGDFKEAERLFREAVERVERGGDVRADFLVGGKHNIALCRLGLGDPDGAERLVNEALGIIARRLGMDAPQAALSYHLLARCEHERGRLDAAEAHCRNALHRRGALRPRVALADTEALLARILLDQGRIDEAEEIVRRVVADRGELFGAGHPARAASSYLLARTCLARNRVEEAETLCRDALAVQEERLVETHPDVRASRELLERIRERLEM